MESFTLNSLFAQLADNSTDYPVESWSPSFSGDIDIKIDQQGHWYHQGSRFERAQLVVLFSKLLICEQGEHYLITPVEKWRIKVEDCPFVVYDIRMSPDKLEAEIGYLGDVEFAPKDWRLASLGDAQVPIVLLGRGLRARVSRSLYYRLVDMAVEKKGEFGVNSPLGWLRLQ